MSLRDLPPREEAYAVWLYNDLTDAVLVDRVVGSSLEVNKVLPADPSRLQVHRRVARADRRQPEPQRREPDARAGELLDAGR